MRTVNSIQRTASPQTVNPNWVEIDAPAKINLFLEVLGKRDDGFHELETVMTTVSVFDRLRLVRREDKQINLTIVNTDKPSPGTSAIPTDDRNLIIRALRRLREFAIAGPEPYGPVDHPCGCDIFLFKCIPSEAGLGGASSDAAAALVAGCKLWNLKIPREQLLDVAAELGSDVPFFLFGGLAVCRGRGELVQPLSGSVGIPIVIAKPVAGLATPLVFGRLRLPDRLRSGRPLIQSLATGSVRQTADLLFNRLQKVAAEMDPQLTILASCFAEINCLGHQLSGSGSSYFGIFASHRAARQAAQVLSARLPDTRIICSQTFSQCPRISA